MNKIFITDDEVIPFSGTVSGHGAAVKLAATWTLTPHLERYAAPVSTLACYFTVLLISVTAIAVLTPLGDALALRHLIPPLACAARSVTPAVMLLPMLPLPEKAATLAAIAIAAGVYAALTAIVSRDAVKMLLGRK